MRFWPRLSPILRVSITTSPRTRGRAPAPSQSNALFRDKALLLRPQPAKLAGERVGAREPLDPDPVLAVGGAEQRDRPVVGLIAGERPEGGQHRADVVGAAGVERPVRGGPEKGGGRLWRRGRGVGGAEG